MMNDIKEIRRRHEDVTGYFADEKGTAAHWDRAALLRMVELLKGALEFERERANGLGEELERWEEWHKYHEEISKNRVDMESRLRAEVERLEKGDE